MIREGTPRGVLRRRQVTLRTDIEQWVWERLGTPGHASHDCPWEFPQGKGMYKYAVS